MVAQRAALGEKERGPPRARHRSAKAVPRRDIPGARCAYGGYCAGDAGNDKIVAWLRGEMRGKASGADVPWSFWQVVTFRNGKLLRTEFFTDRAKALAAVGLSEHHD